MYGSFVDVAFNYGAGIAQRSDGTFITFGSTGDAGALSSWGFPSSTLSSYGTTNNSLAEGGVATFVGKTSTAAAGTAISYTLTGSATASDYIDPIGGQVVVGPNGRYAVNLFVTDDQATEGNETLTITVQGKTASTTIVDTSTTPTTPTYSVSANQSSVNEGSTATFTVSTTNVASGTALAYTLSGVSAADITGGSLSGTTTVGSNGQATISVPIAADQTTEGNETLTVTVQGKSASTTIVDTSTTPVTYLLQQWPSGTSANEGSFADFAVTTTGVASGSVISYTISGGVSVADLGTGSLTGTVVVGANGIANISIPLVADNATEGNETLTVSLQGQSSSIIVNDTSTAPVATYAISLNQSSVNEGSTATFTVSTTNVASGTSLAYTLSGVSAADITGGSLSGTTTVGSNGQATISVPIAADQMTEGNETLTVTVQGKTASTTIVDTSTTPVTPTYSVTANQSSVNEGSTATFTVLTTNVAAGSSLAYTLSGISAADITSGSLSGTTTVGSNGQATISVPIAADQTTEGNESLIVTVQGKTASTTIVDTSTTPTGTYALAASAASVNEGGTASFILTTTNVAAGTSLAYSISGVSASDLFSNSLSGAVSVASGGTTVISIPVLADNLTEGTETMTVLLQGKSASINILDTSTTPNPTYSISSNTSEVNEGSSVIVTLSTTNVAAGTVYPWAITSLNMTGRPSSADFDNGVTEGLVVVDNNGKAVVTLPVKADQLTEGYEDIYFSFYTDTTKTKALANATASIKDTSIAAATYSFSATNATVNEGNTATFTLSTANVTAGSSVPYTISGVSSSDIVGGALSGSVVIASNGQATISVPIAADQVTEGTETLTLTVQGNSASTQILDTSLTPASTYAITPKTATVDEGKSAEFTVTTTNVAAGTSLNYTLTGIGASDVIGGLLIGTTTVASNGLATITVPIAPDLTTEGPETLTVTLEGKAASVLVNDTSLSPPATYQVSPLAATVDEGGIASFSVETTNVTAGTSLIYTLSGVTASDVVGGSLTGTTVVGANGKASISVPIAADLTTEGAETLTLTLQGKSASVTINDTSITPTVTDFRDVTALQDSSGHFLFTGNATEAEIMQQFGWKQATGLKAFETVDHPAGVTLHKFYYPPTNSFYYATDDQAKAVKAAFTGWVYQGATDMKVFTEAQLKSGVAPKDSVPIYQMWVNGTGHVYTTDTTLVDTLMGQDINTDLLTANNVATSKGTYNGVVFWGDPVGNNTSGSLSSTTSSSTEYRFVTALQDKEGHFLFTANQTEADIMQQFGWSVAAGVKGFESADTASGVTLHKFYYPPTNSFYYATDDQAKAVKASFTGWDYQGATDLKVYTNTSYAAGKAPTGSVPIYQMWVNGKGHVYTTDTVLVDQLMGQDINTNVLTANNVATANGTYNGVVFWGDPTTKTPVVPVDTTPPTVSSIQITGVDSNNVAKSGALVQGNRVKVVLTMSEATAVIGTPSFSIDVGGITKTAQYASGSGSNALTFYYAVEAGDLDSTGGITALANALTLPSGSSIKDSAGNNATLTTTGIATGTNTVSIDAVAPTVRSYSPTSGATNVAIGSNFVFTFSEAIKKGAGVILLLDARGSVVESFNVLTSSRLTWASNTVTIDPSSDLSINQLYRFEIPAGAIDDEAGNDYAGTSTYTITTVGEAGPPPGF